MTDCVCDRLAVGVVDAVASGDWVSVNVSTVNVTSFEKDGVDVGDVTSTVAVRVWSDVISETVMELVFVVVDVNSLDHVTSVAVMV